MYSLYKGGPWVLPRKILKNLVTKSMLLKHNDNKTCISVVRDEQKKKKSRPTYPFFFQTCYSKHTYVLFSFETNAVLAA